MAVIGAAEELAERVAVLIWLREVGFEIAAEPKPAHVVKTELYKKTG